MIAKEPLIEVGIIEGRPEIRCYCAKSCVVNGDAHLSGEFIVRRNGEMLELSSSEGVNLRATEFLILPESGGFSLHDVIIGVQFHWERSEEQSFHGDLRLVQDGAGVTAINRVGLEEYLKSVISSEMSAESPRELLHAHAITSRSWLVAMLEKQMMSKKLVHTQRSQESPGQLLRWYDREDHVLFNVCADDHCQRYQGVTKIISSEAERAVEGTRGVCLLYGDTVCDARFSKACGGITEDFGTAWDDARVPYLRSVPDSAASFPPVEGEEAARAWIMSRPKAYCNVENSSILKTILPSFDRETSDFFRWNITYSQDELSGLLRRRSGLDFGSIVDLIPIQRGPSGRIVRLRIVGSKKTLIVGKELEIRKWFSPTHLYSSAFVVSKAPGGENVPGSFTLHGAGWGHGVGLCQIGAAVMAAEGNRAAQILTHYFTGAELKKLY